MPRKPPLPPLPCRDQTHIKISMREVRLRGLLQQAREGANVQAQIASSLHWVNGARVTTKALNILYGVNGAWGIFINPNKESPTLLTLSRWAALWGVTLDCAAWVLVVMRGWKAPRGKDRIKEMMRNAD